MNADSTASGRAILRSAGAVIAGFVVAYAIAIIIMLMRDNLFVGDSSDALSPVVVAVALTATTIGAILGGMTTARATQQQHARRDAGALGLLLLVFNSLKLSYATADGPIWIAVALALLGGAGAVAGGAVLARMRRRAIADSLPVTLDAPSVDTRFTQVLLAILLLLSSSIITAHMGGDVLFAVGMMVFLSPVSAVVAIAITGGLIQAALKLRARAFALCCSAAAVLILAVPVLGWTIDFRWDLVLTGAPFVVIWLGILGRAIFAPGASTPVVIASVSD